MVKRMVISDVGGPALCGGQCRSKPDHCNALPTLCRGLQQRSLFVDLVLKPHRRGPDQPKTIDVVYGPAEGRIATARLTGIAPTTMRSRTGQSTHPEAPLFRALGKRYPIEALELPGRWHHFRSRTELRIHLSG
jgi:hypothetical protein